VVVALSHGDVVIGGQLPSVGQAEHVIQSPPPVVTVTVPPGGQVLPGGAIVVVSVVVYGGGQIVPPPSPQLVMYEVTGLQPPVLDEYE